MYKSLILVFGATLALSSCNPFETEASRTAEIAKNVFDVCVRELPKYMKNTLQYEINEACTVTANNEAKKQYAVEKLTGKKGPL